MALGGQQGANVALEVDDAALPAGAWQARRSRVPGGGARLRALAGSACDVLRRGLIFLADRFGRDRLTGGQNEVGRVLSGLVRRMGTREFEGASREFEELVFPPCAPSAPAPSAPCAEPQDSPEL